MREARESPFRRRHLIELHEQPWFPETWRDLFRAGLGKAFVLFGLSRECARAVDRFLEHHRAAEMLDLCSGSGELSADTVRRANESGRFPRCTLVMSDLYPDRPRWTTHQETSGFVEAPLDYRSIRSDLPRTWMMLNALHHLRPEELREFLRHAADAADAVVMIDRDARNWREMFMTILVVPLAAAFITAFMVRPFRPRNLLWGLVVPVIPLVALVDGLVSNLRSYTVAELERVVEDLGASFTWEIGRTPGGEGVPPMTYIFGFRAAGDMPSPLRRGLGLRGAGPRA